MKDMGWVKDDPGPLRLMPISRVVAKRDRLELAMTKVCAFVVGIL
jgi:hypothetical protein